MYPDKQMDEIVLCNFVLTNTIELEGTTPDVAYKGLAKSPLTLELAAQKSQRR
jgi:hypothetical protein